jgi:hypothetical protein
MQVFDFDQGTEAWTQARLGIPTGSRFADIMAEGDGKMRRKYLFELAGERITRRGRRKLERQPLHRARQGAWRTKPAITTPSWNDAEPVRVGFIRNGEKSAAALTAWSATAAGWRSRPSSRDHGRYA